MRIEQMNSTERVRRVKTGAKLVDIIKEQNEREKPTILINSKVPLPIITPPLTFRNLNGK